MVEIRKVKHTHAVAQTSFGNSPRTPRMHVRRVASIAMFALLVDVCAVTLASAADATTKPKTTVVENNERIDRLPEQLHDAWTRILKLHVRDGFVDYEAIRSTASDEFEAYLAALESVSRNQLAASSRNAQLAFWINAYNAFTVRLILDHYPVEGIWKVVPFWKRALGGPFALEFIPLGDLAPEPQKGSVSLGFIEHEILRAHFEEPRIHFAIVCASISCPPLAPEAYRPGNLDEAFAASARTFFAEPEKNRYDPASNTLWVSPIFKWFAEDFAAAGGPAGYFGEFGPKEAVTALRAAEKPPKIEFTAYDWSLNGR